MVALRRIRLLAIAFPALLLITPVAAEVRLSGDIDVYESILRLGPEDWRSVSAGTGAISLSGVGSRNVRGELALSVPLAAIPSVSVDRAYVRFRLPGFRTTVGRTALSWGEGLLLNAGDFPNAEYDPTEDLLSGKFRSTGIWQIEVFVPLGLLSFVEAVVLPELAEPMTPRALEDARVGGRVYIDVDVVALQAGYLFGDPMHRIFASVQGHLGIELYAAIAHQLEHGSEDIAEAFVSTFVMTAGGFHSFSVGRDRTLSMRVETRVSPTGIEDGVPEAAIIGALVDFAPLSTLSFGLQSFVSPTDPSALLAGTVNWNVDQGLSLIAAVRGNVGASDTVYDSDSSGTPTITIGVRYSF